MYVAEAHRADDSQLEPALWLFLQADFADQIKSAGQHRSLLSPAAPDRMGRSIALTGQSLQARCQELCAIPKLNNHDGSDAVPP